MRLRHLLSAQYGCSSAVPARRKGRIDGSRGERWDPEQQLVPRNHIQHCFSRSLVMTVMAVLQKELGGGEAIGGQGGKEKEEKKERVFESLNCSPAHWTIYLNYFSPYKFLDNSEVPG